MYFKSLLCSFYVFIQIKFKIYEKIFLKDPKNTTETSFV